MDLANFYTRIRWKIASGELTDTRDLTINFFRFVFRPPVSGDDQYPMYDFLDRHPIQSVDGILTFSVWLLQHDIPFRIRFRYNRTLPFWVNMLSIPLPRRIDRTVHRDRDRFQNARIVEKTSVPGVPGEKAVYLNL